MAGTRRKRRPPRSVVVALENLAPATADYLAILRAALPGLDALTRLEGSDLDTEQRMALAECVRAAVEVDDAPGTVAGIAVLLDRAFGIIGK